MGAAAVRSLAVGCCGLACCSAAAAVAPPSSKPPHVLVFPLCSLVAEEELRQKAAAVSQQYGTQVGTSTANLLNPQEIR